MSSNQGLEDQEAMEIKNSLINQLPSQCRELGIKFFNCIEEYTTKEIQSRPNSDNISYEDLEKIISEKVLPVCSSKFDVEKCFNENSK